MIAFYDPIQATGWGMATVAYQDELFAPVSNVLKIMIGISLLLILLITFGVILTINKAMAPLAIMLDEMHLLAGGDFRRIIEIVEAVSTQIQHISTEISGMAQNGEEIVGHIRTIGEASRSAAQESETVSAATEEQSASVQEIANASDSLAKMAMELQSEIAKFQV